MLSPTSTHLIATPTRPTLAVARFFRDPSFSEPSSAVYDTPGFRNPETGRVSTPGENRFSTVLGVNHAAIATQAMRYRLRKLDRPLDDDSLVRAAHEAVCRADPDTDRALRTLGTAWVEAGLAPEAITRSWNHPEVDALFASQPHLVDALDVLASRIRFASPVG